ncbi:hypothetical protein D3C71_1904310 [compost metagenome]
MAIRTGLGMWNPCFRLAKGLSVLASSRVNPLPQVRHSIQSLCSPCGSGFTREEAEPAIPHSWLNPPSG